jgi:hypothetical protein
MNHSSESYESYEPDAPAAGIGTGTGSPTERLPAAPAGQPPITAEAAQEAFEIPDPDRQKTGLLPLPPAADDTFIPKARFSMGRSTKVLVCVALVMAGALGGAAVQKGLDAGNRGARSNFSNVQNQGPAATPGQGRRGGGTQTGTPGNATGGATGTPQPSPGN